MLETRASDIVEAPLTPFAIDTIHLLLDHLVQGPCKYVPTAFIKSSTIFIPSFLSAVVSAIDFARIIKIFDFGKCLLFRFRLYRPE